MPIEQLRRCLETGDWVRLADVYPPAALLDANVPLWRFQRESRADGGDGANAQAVDAHHEAAHVSLSTGRC